MSALSRATVDSWQVGSTIKLAPEMMRLTLLIVARTLFGTDADRYTDQIAESMEIAIDRIERTMLPGLDRLDSLPLPYWRKFRQAADELAAIAEDLIAERRQRNAEGDDLLGLLLALRDEDGSAFTDDEVRDEALTLILSGHETTANALTWAFGWLGTRPDVFAALRDEALRRTGSPLGPATVADVMSTGVAGQVVSESLRLAPPVWVAPAEPCRTSWLTVCGYRREPTSSSANTSPTEILRTFPIRIRGSRHDGRRNYMRISHVARTSPSVPGLASASVTSSPCSKHASSCCTQPPVVT